jgi:hypothetical protein
MKNPEALTFRTPRGLFRPVAGKLYLYLSHDTSFSRDFDEVRSFSGYAAMPTSHPTNLFTDGHGLISKENFNVHTTST